MRPAGRPLVVVTWCCQYVPDPPVLAEHLYRSKTAPATTFGVVTRTRDLLGVRGAPRSVGLHDPLDRREEPFRIGAEALMA
jgi:hypothetical protein